MYDALIKNMGNSFIEIFRFRKTQRNICKGCHRFKLSLWLYVVFDGFPKD